MRGLQTHFNEPVDPEILRELAAKGVQMCRMDCQHVDDSVLVIMVDAVVDELTVIEAGALVPPLRPLVIIERPEQIRRLEPGALADYRNEPDLEGPDPATYRAGVEECTIVAREMGVTLCAGSVSGLHQRGLEYLRALGPLPDGVIYSPHRYPPPGATWSTPGGGYSSRQDEVKALRAIIGNRPFGIGEFGYHTAPEQIGWGPFAKTKRRSDEQATWDIQHEFAFWESEGAQFAVLYQLNCAEGDAVLANYGIRRADGSWKPQVDCFKVVV